MLAVLFLVKLSSKDYLIALAMPGIAVRAGTYHKPGHFSKIPRQAR
jgi:hypothetical protein